MGTLGENRDRPYFSHLKAVVAVTLFRKYSIAGVIALAFGIASSPALPQRTRPLDRTPFELLIDLKWQGRDLEVRKVLSCDLHKRYVSRNTADDHQARWREIWEQNVNRVSYVLPSGELLIFVIPSICRTFNGGIDPLSLLDDFIPITYWLDNATSPKEVEVLRSYRYFTDNPQRRFVIRRVQFAETKAPKTSIDDDQSKVHLFKSPGPPEAYFVSVNAAVFPKAVWARFPELAAELVKYSKSATVDRSVVKKAAALLLDYCDRDARGAGPATDCYPDGFNDRPYAVAAKPENDGWSIDYEDVGVTRARRYLEARDLDQTGCTGGISTCNLFKGSYRVTVAGEMFEFPRRGYGLVFDAKNQLLIRTWYQVHNSGSQAKVN